MSSKVFKVIGTVIGCAVLIVAVTVIADKVRPYGCSLGSNTILNNNRLIRRSKENKEPEPRRDDSFAHYTGESKFVNTYIASPRPYVRQPMNDSRPFNGGDSAGEIKVPPTRRHMISEPAR